MPRELQLGDNMEEQEEAKYRLFKVPTVQKIVKFCLIGKLILEFFWTITTKEKGYVNPN